MMPHQIYCDYLEDKGIDCRLLRSIKPEIELCYEFIEQEDGDNEYHADECDGSGDGCAWGNYGAYTGDGGHVYEDYDMYTELYDEVYNSGWIDVTGIIAPYHGS